MVMSSAVFGTPPPSPHQFAHSRRSRKNVLRRNANHLFKPVAPLKPRIHRPRPHIVTLTAALVILVCFIVFSRGSTFLSHRVALSIQQPSHSEARPPSSAQRMPVAAVGASSRTRDSLYEQNRNFRHRNIASVQSQRRDIAPPPVDSLLERPSADRAPHMDLARYLTADDTSFHGRVQDRSEFASFRSGLGPSRDSAAASRGEEEISEYSWRAANEDYIQNLKPIMMQLVAADGTRFDVEVGGHSFQILDAGKKEELAVRDTLKSIGAHDANIAFFLQISEENIALLPRLLVTMWHPRNVYVVHLDSKIPDEKAKRLAITLSRNPKLSNVHLLEREPITYKGVSMLLNTLAAIEYLLYTKYDWDYFVNLSGADYPLVNVGTMRRLLGQSEILDKNVTFLQIATNKAFWERMRKYRFNYVFYDTAVGMKKMDHELRKTWVLHPLANELGIEFVQAEAWIIAHRSFAEFAVRSTFSKKLLVLLSGMQDPEEHYFAMLAWNNPRFNKTLAHHSFRDIVWDFKGKMSGQHPYYVDQRMEDGTFPFWDLHISRSKYLFCRKFRDPQSPLLDRIDRVMSGTHSLADVVSVSRAVSTVRDFVRCIADIKHPSYEIRSNNICG